LIIINDNNDYGDERNVELILNRDKGLYYNLCNELTIWELISDQNR